MHGKIFYGGKEIPFKNLSRLAIQADGKLWRYFHHTQKEMTFTLAEFVAPNSNQAIGDWVKRWRKRTRIVREGTTKPRPLTQAEAAALFGVSQSLIAKIEAGKKMINEEMFLKIRKHIQEHRRRNIPPNDL
jgi:DNA-binding XRE family transcriptional regulator